MPSSPPKAPSGSCTRLPPRCAVPLHLDFTSVYRNARRNREVMPRHAAYGVNPSTVLLTREVFRPDLVEELAELLDLVLLLVRDHDAGLGQHLVGAPDRRAHPQRQRDR